MKSRAFRSRKTGSMRRLIPAAAVLAVLVGLAAGQAAGLGESSPTTPAAKTPRWVTHVARYPGGISGSVRAVYAARGQNGGQARARARATGAGPKAQDTNVQMNDDSYPPLPQNETAVAYKVTEPDVAVAAANDYVSGGVVVLSTSDSGRHWASTPSSPHYGRIYVTYTKFHIQPDGFSDYCPIQLSYTDSIPTQNPVLTTWSHTAVQPDNPGGDGTGSSANQHSDPVVENNGTLDVGFVSENCNDSVDPHLLFQKSTDGGLTFLPSAVQIDKAGQYADFQDAGNDDTLPPTHFRAPNTTSLAYSPQTGKLLYVYQNNINRPTSQADISYQTSNDGGLTWSDSRFLSTNASGQPAPNDQFFPWAASDEVGHFYVIWFDRRLDPANVRINTWQAVSNNDAASFGSAKISSSDWDPNLGFFTSGAFIGDYNGLAASTRAVYAVWTDGRDDAIGETGLGETDVFTAFQKNP